MKLQLKEYQHIKTLLGQYPVWAEYYSPDDIENLVLDGFNRGEIEKALKAIDYSNDFVFQVVNYEKESPYEFTLYRAEYIFPNTAQLTGYIFYIKGSGINSLSVFHKELVYVLNLSDPEITEEDENDLKNILQLDSIYPIDVSCDYGLKIRQNFDPYK
jgi:hypothetical protein